MMWPDMVLHQMPVCPHVSVGTVHDNKLLKTGMHQAVISLSVSTDSPAGSQSWAAVRMSVITDIPCKVERSSVKVRCAFLQKKRKPISFVIIWACQV